MKLAARFAWETVSGLELLVARLGSATAVFSTRAGGVSGAPYESLNLGTMTGDAFDDVAENRRRLMAALRRGSDSVVWAKQVHGAELEQHERSPRRDFIDTAQELPDADGQLVRSAELTPLVLVADCLPVVIASPSAVAVVHCGWRGVEAGIVGQAVEELGNEDLEVAIGPGIGPCCYEVGEEVVAAFARRGHEAERMLDLPSIVERELVASGVGAERVASCRLCTSCDPELFFSHRRDGERSGRQAGLAWLSS